jgi:DNA-binding NarL/FixJ family response regulator
LENHLPEEPTRVFLVIESRLVRETLIRLFRKRTDLCVVGEGCSIEAMDLLDPPCDILVLDDLQVLLPLGARPGAGNGPMGIVLIGMEEDEKQFLLAVQSGISAYLLNDASAGDVVAAVRAAARGEAVCPPNMCQALFHFVAGLAKGVPAMVKQKSAPGLTIRQQQLISLVAKGLTNKEIASHLNLSEFTIKNHIHRIMKQVEAVSRSKAVEAARASGYAMVV